MSPRTEPSQRSGRRRSRAWSLIAFGLACLVVLALLEGASSLLVFAEALHEDVSRPLAERRHTRYDPELGWVHRPDLHLPDFYGPGRSLTINAQGFRNQRRVDIRVPEGKRRIICSGDSFTLGYGVGDEETWCARLAARDPRFESVNMGQGGYGIGQAYLWYVRDGARLEHHVHVFAFITADFGRLLSERFQGYGKPVLRVRNGKLVTENIPVPRAAYAIPWLAEHREVLGELRSLELLRRILRRLRPPRAPDPSHGDLPLVATKVFEALQRLNEEKGSTLVLCYLPTRAEYRGALDERLPRFVRKAARRRGILYVDLLEELRRLPAREVASLYLRRSEAGFRDAEAHLSAKGNEWVAVRLHQRIAELPAMRRHLD